MKIISLPAQVNIDFVLQDMSQFSLIYLDIIGLKNQNKNLENLALKREEERKTWENKCKYLSDKNDKIMKQVTGYPVEGDNHIIWDVLIAEAALIRLYFGQANCNARC